MFRIIMGNVDPPPTQLSLLDKNLPYKLNLKHGSTKIPNQCKFEVHCQRVHIIMHVENYRSLTLFSSLSGTTFQHNGRTLSSMDMPDSCCQGLDNSISSWILDMFLFFSLETLWISGIIGYGVGSILGNIFDSRDSFLNVARDLRKLSMVKVFLIIFFQILLFVMP